MNLFNNIFWFEVIIFQKAFPTLNWIDFNSYSKFRSNFVKWVTVFIVVSKEIAHFQLQISRYYIFKYIIYVVYIVIPLHHLKKGYPGFIHYLFFSISFLLLISEEKNFCQKWRFSVREKYFQKIILNDKELYCSKRFVDDIHDGDNMMLAATKSKCWWQFKYWFLTNRWNVLLTKFMEYVTNMRRPLSPKCSRVNFELSSIRDPWTRPKMYLALFLLVVTHGSSISIPFSHNQLLNLESQVYEDVAAENWMSSPRF